MPAKPKPIRPVEKSVSLPEDLLAKVELELFSELEGRVPKGAWSGYVEALVRQSFDARERRQAFLNAVMKITADHAGDVEAMHSRLDEAMEGELFAAGHVLAVELIRQQKRFYA